MDNSGKSDLQNSSTWTTKIKRNKDEVHTVQSRGGQALGRNLSLVRHRARDCRGCIMRCSMHRHTQTKCHSHGKNGIVHIKEAWQHDLKYHYIWSHSIEGGIEVGWFRTLGPYTGPTLQWLCHCCVSSCVFYTIFVYHVLSMCELRHRRHPSSWWQPPRNILLTTQFWLRRGSASHSIAVQNFHHSFDRASRNQAANACNRCMNLHAAFSSWLIYVRIYVHLGSSFATHEDGQNGAACVVRFLQEMAPRGCGCVASRCSNSR